jgi:putative MATE family efflux protein
MRCPSRRNSFGKEPELKNERAKTRGLYDYTKGSISWAITRLSVPMCVEQIIRNVDGVLEIYWIGMLGPEFLAATSLGFMSVLFFRAGGFGIRISGQALIAQRIGAEDNEGASIYAGQAIIILMFYSLAFTILGLLCAPYVMALLTTDPVILRHGTNYMRAGFAVFVAWEGMFVYSSILRGAGEAGYTLVAMIAGVCVSIFAVPLLIFGAGPVPAMGIAGGFLGMGTGRFTGWLVMVYIVATGRSRVKLHFSDLRPRVKESMRIISMAWPVSVQNLLERGANIILLRMLSSFGPFALAAWAIGNRITLIARMPSFGLQGSVRTLVGQNLGAGLPERAVRTVKIALGAMTVLMGFVSVTMFVFAPDIVVVFGMGGEGAGIGAVALRILCVGLVMESARRVAAGVFQGSGITKPPMMIEGVVRWVVQLPAAFLMVFPLGVGAASIWLAIAGSQAISGAAMLIWLWVWSRRGGLVRRSVAINAERAGSA